MKEPYLEDFWSKRRKSGLFICITAFLVLVLLLSALVGNAVVSMAKTANSIDDDRARISVDAGLQSLRSKMDSVVRDNAFWDDAARMIYVVPEPDRMAETWATAAREYVTPNDTYDTTVIVDPAGKTIMATRFGEILANTAEELYPKVFTDISIRLRHEMEKGAEYPVIIEYAIGPEGLMIIGAAPVIPDASVDGFDPEHFAILVFSKFLGDRDIARLGETVSIEGLSLGGNNVTGKSTAANLVVPVYAFDGKIIAVLEWQPKKPGWKSLASVANLLGASFLFLLLFLAAVIAFAIVSLRIIHKDQHKAYLLSTRDALSGLLNRSGFFRKLNNAHKRLKSAGRVHSLVYLDLDGFKEVNDTWGHPAGDQLIRAVGEMLAALAPATARTARVGGDEFAILIAGDTGAAAQDVALKIHQAFSVPVNFVNWVANIGASIGIAVQDDPAIDPEEFVRRADMAMYHAKQTGRGRTCVYGPEIEAGRESKSELERELRAALVAGTIEVAFQPLVDARTGSLRGLEGLARWNSPKRGSVAPEVFIEVAERTGLIESLGLYVLENALAAVKAWPGLKISVNVSPAQLPNPSFAEQVRDLLAKTGVEPSRLTLEITEGFLVRQPERAKKALLALRAVGVSIALDDFGAGYASIGYLRQFHFDRLKIDKSLVSALDRDPSAAGVLQATVALAKAFQIPVTAEGVEREEQAVLLRLAGCDELQGYLFGMPRTATDIERDYFPLPLAG